MAAPAIVIRLELEAAPRVYCDLVGTGEADRLSDWLREHPDYLDLYNRAVELTEQERAA